MDFQPQILYFEIKFSHQPKVSSMCKCAFHTGNIKVGGGLVTLLVASTKLINAGPGG